MAPPAVGFGRPTDNRPCFLSLRRYNQMAYKMPMPGKRDDEVHHGEWINCLIIFFFG